MKKPSLRGEALWDEIRREVTDAAFSEPILAGFLHLTVLRNRTLNRVLAFHLSSKLTSPVMDSRALYEIFLHVLEDNPDIGEAAQDDLIAHYERDPACDSFSMPLLYFKGYHALQTHRINHVLWERGRQNLAYFLQNRASEVFGIDIHPAARCGRGIMIDHGTGLVVGETAVLGNNISVLHGVTLGGSGKASGDRHPKIGDGVMIGAGVSILGNISVGENARIGAGSVVLADVPARCTVVGVPARVVGTTENTPAADMKQTL